MAILSDRINVWVENRVEAWKERLRGWAISVIGLGIETFLDVIAKSLAKKLLPIIEKIEKNVEIPPELRPIFDELKKPTGEAAAALTASFSSSLISSASGTLTDWLLRSLVIGLSYIPGFHLPRPETLIAMQMRNYITMDNLYGLMRGWGLSPQNVDDLIYLSKPRFPPDVVSSIWLRDKEKNAIWWADIEQQGLTPDRIEVLKELAHRIPSVQDIIRYVVREAYSPEIYEQFGQHLEYPSIAEKDAEKAGVRPDHLLKEWISHWDLPSPLQGFEMLHRGVIDEKTLKLLLRALDVMPYWRDKLMAISWAVPTRVDVRRFWDMRTIDEARLREVYTALGYHGKDLDDYVLWTKIHTDFPDLLARYKNGWITLDQVKRELIAIGMKPERADTMIEEKIKKAAPERVAKERDLTAAEIIKGVKKEVITRAEGQELLMDMGYDEREAEFKLAIELTAMAGSPESYTEFKDLTQKYRKASGLEGKPMNEEIRKAATEVIRLTGERDSLQRSIDEEKRGLIGEEGLPAEATARLNKLKASLRKAEAALLRAKTEYNRLVAEGKFS